MDDQHPKGSPFKPPDRMPPDKTAPDKTPPDKGSRLDALRELTVFGLGRMFLFVSVVAAAAAPLAYLARGLRGNRESLLVFILLCLAGPFVALIIFSTFLRLYHWFQQRRS